MIEIISGTYGAHDGLKTASDAPFSLSPAEEKRLVGRGVARYVPQATTGVPATPVATPPSGNDGGGEGDDTHGAGNGAEGKADGGSETLDIVDGHFTAESLTLMTNKSLAKLGMDLGADVSKCKTKADFVAVLVAVELPPNEDEEGDTPPDLGAEDLVK